MTMSQEIIDDLNKHLALCQEALAVFEREGQTLRRADNPSLFEFYQFRKSFLPRFNQSLEGLKKHRARWQQIPLAEREKYSEVNSLLRQNQDLTMKTIILDRENEQSLLRRGRVPARALPSVNQQRPHFVADLYRRQSAV